MKFSELPNHHAVLIVHSNRDELSNELFKELQLLSPIHRFFNQTVLNIDSARTIISWANTPYNENKIGVISFHTIGLEAQNALLKLLEEPRNGVSFILITSNTSNLIPTVLSRVLLVQDHNEDENLSEAEKFLNTDHTLRMKLPYVVDILSRTDEEDRKDRESVKAFIMSLSTVLTRNEVNSKYILETIETASYASDPSASGKALIEYLSLLLPKSKV